MIIYSKSSGLNPASVGKLETPIKMIIEHENELQKNIPSIYNTLFNLESSNRFGETVVSESEFNYFRKVAEGEAALLDTVEEVGAKFIEHVQFMKEFIISAEMMEDANFGIASSAKRRAENFVRAYYKSMNLLCSKALGQAVAATFNHLGTTLDLTTPDGKPLYSASHKWGTTNGTHGTQSNFFYGDIFSSGGEEERVYDITLVEDALTKLQNQFRNMKDDNGGVLGYTPDTIILPGNRPQAEAMIKKVCGSYNVVGSSLNDFNVHYGKWNVIVLPYWTSNEDSFIMMSTEANKDLGGNMFFNRVPLTVTNWVDHHTGNYIWNGRCRFGLGFGTYKHILMAIDCAYEREDATNMYDI